MELQTQRPQRISFFKSLRKGAHLKCLALTILIVTCGVIIIWCRVARVSRLVVNFHNFPVSSKKETSPCEDGYYYIPVAFIVMLYLVYLVECWHCSTRLELAYKLDVEDVYHYVENMRKSQPIIWWKAISYHYIRRARQVTRYRNGDAYTTPQIYYERVNSRSSASYFVYSHCGSKDISKKLVDLEKHPVTKIRFSKGFAFANLETATDFEEQRLRFFRDNECYDDYTEMREGLDLLGAEFQEYMVAFAGKDQLPWYVSQTMFWAFSLLLLSWPLRLIIGSKTAYVHYQITKLFGASSLLPSSTPPNQLSRANTNDSIEIERLIADSIHIAPSYSEAALISDNIHLLNSNESSVEREEDLRPWLSSHRVLSGPSVNQDSASQEHPKIPKSISQPFKPFHDTRRLNFSHRQILNQLPRTTPPTYEDAVLLSYPVISYKSLTRSVTDRDLSLLAPPRMPYRSLSSFFHWRKRETETFL